MSNNYNNDSEKEDFLFSKNKELPFTVPEGYFESFAVQLINKMDVMEELAEFSTLSAVPKQLLYTVPRNYFTSTENLLDYKYELSAFPLLDKIHNPLLKPLSEDAFDNLSLKIQEQIELLDELKSYHTLYAIDKTNGFSVSPGYFENAAEDIKNAIHSDAHYTPSVIERIIGFILKPKVALAYSVIFLLGIFSIIYFNNSTKELPGDCKTLACLEKNELLNDNNVSDFNDEDLYDMVDVNELDKQLSGGAEKDSLNENKNN